MRDMIDRIGSGKDGGGRVWPLKFFVAHLEGLFHTARRQNPDGRLSRLEFPDFLALFLGPIVYRRLAGPVIAGMKLDASSETDGRLLDELADLLGVGGKLP